MAGACVDNGSQTEAQTSANNLLGDDARVSISDNLTEKGLLLEEAVLKYQISTDTQTTRNEETTYYINTGGISPEIHQITGSGVDREGRADTWLFGIRYGKNTSLVYSYNSWWNEAVWPGPLSEDKIDTDSIIMPSELLSRNTQSVSSLFDNSGTGKISLVLKEGVYYLSPEQSEDITGLKFSAYTGEVIS